jgi:DNA polymerase/3'-5' exonuclease PolX
MYLSLSYAKRLTDRVIELLSPVCEHIECAGNVRRMKEPVDYLDIVVIPLRHQVQKNLFEYGLVIDDGFRQAVDQWIKIKGEASDRYMERWLPGAFTLRIHVADEDNFGLVMAMATGNFAFRQTLKTKWSRRRWTSAGGYMRKSRTGELIPVPDEQTLFALLKMDYVKPENRNQDLTDEQRSKLNGPPR